MVGIEPVDNIYELESEFDATNGAISKSGKFFWRYVENALQLIKLPTGLRLAEWQFFDGSTPYSINFAEEIVVHGRIHILVGLSISNKKGELRLIDLQSSKTTRIIQLREKIPTIATKIEKPSLKNIIDDEEFDSMDDQNHDEAIQSFIYPVAIGTLTGDVLIIDLFFKSKYRETIGKIEHITNVYESLEDLSDDRNHACFLLETKSNSPVTCVHHVNLSKYGSILFVGDNRSTTRIWKLNEQVPTILAHEITEKKGLGAPIFAYVYDPESETLLVATSEPNEALSRAIHLKATQNARISAYSLRVVNDDLSIQSKQYSRVFQEKKQRNKRTSRLISVNVFPSACEYVLFVWESRSATIHDSESFMEVLRVSDIAKQANSDSENFGFTKCEVPVGIPLLSAALLAHSAEDFSQSLYKNKNEFIDRIFGKDLTNSKIVRRHFTVTFEVLFGYRGRVVHSTYHGAQRQVIRQIHHALHKRLETSVVMSILRECVRVGLLHQVAEDEIMFDMFDILIRNRQVAIICQYITHESRLEKVSQWLLQRYSNLDACFKTELVDQNVNMKLSALVDNAFVLLRDFESILHCLLSNANFAKFSMKENLLYQQLDQLLPSMEIHSQYVELWSWFYQNDLIGFGLNAHALTASSASELFIDCMIKEANFPAGFHYPPESSLALLTEAFKEYKDPSNAQLIKNKFKVLFYYLNDVSEQAGRDYCSSFIRTASLLLSNENQELVKGYWILDRKRGGLEQACTLLTRPAVEVDYPIKVLKCFSSDLDVAQRFLLHTNTTFSKQNHLQILEILLSKNISMALEFVRRNSVATLKIDDVHQANLMNTIFEFCLKNAKIEALFLFPLSSAEETLLMTFLTDARQPDLKTLYYLQRSQFIKVLADAERGKSPLVDQYLSVLPPALVQYAQSTQLHAAREEKINSVVRKVSSDDTSASVKTPRVLPNTPYAKTKIQRGNQPFTPYSRSAKTRRVEAPSSNAQPIPFFQ